MSARSLVDEAAEFYSAPRGFESYRARHLWIDAIVTGKTESGVNFRLDVSEKVSADDLRTIANAMHAIATKIESEQLRQSHKQERHLE